MSKKGNKEKKDFLTKENIVYVTAFVSVLILVGFLCFYKLDAKYVDAWDEARHGVNAYEMANGGSLLQNTYLRQADYYNLKPPVSMWGIMFGFALFGNTVFGLRFYAALSYLLLVLAIGLFARRYGKVTSILVMLFLAINTTPIQAHMIRAGDADSLYVLLFSLAMLAMMNVKQNVKWVYACGFFASMAFLTKSFHALLIPAIGFFYLLFTGLLKKMKWKDWLFFLLAFFLPVLCWALLRMRVDGTTFLKAMWETDVLGRTSGELKNNISPFTYYLQYYFGASSGKTTVYLCALVIVLVGMFRYPYLLSWKKREEWLGYTLWFLVPVLAFSAVTNKLIWYLYPALIPLLMMAAIYMAKLMTDRNLFRFMRILCGILCVVMVCYFFKQEVTIINSQGPNEIQTLLTKVAQQTGVTKVEAYAQYEEPDNIGDPSSWCQQDVFVMEITGDYQCINGGVKACLLAYEETKEPCILLIAKSLGEDLDRLPVLTSEHYEVYLIQ